MVASLICSFLLAAPLAAAPVTTKQDVGPIAVEVDLREDVVNLAEPVEISVTFLSLPHVEMRWPDLEPDASFRLIDTQMDGPDLLGRFQARRWHARVEPLKLGKLQLPPINLEYRSGEEAWATGSISIPPVEVVPGPTSSSDPSTLRPIPSLPDETPSTTGIFRWFRYAGLILAAIFGPWALFTWLRSHSERTSPAEEALRELAQIEKVFTASPQDPRQTIVQVSDLIREHLGRAFGLSAPLQSTPEILSDSGTVASLSLVQREALAEFLQAADIEKFAPGEPTAEDCRICIRRARAFLASESAS